MISGSVAQAKFVSMMMSPSLVRSAQDECWRVPSQYRLSKTLYGDAYHVARQRPGTSIIHVTRSAVAFTTVADVERHFGALATALEGLERKRYDLLLDIRLAVGRNDPEFEIAIEPYRVRMQRGFRRIAVVLNSIAGQLQIKRLALKDGVVVHTFPDEEIALEWLTQSA